MYIYIYVDVHICIYVFCGGALFQCVRMLTCKFKIYRYIIYTIHIYNSLCGNGFQHVFFEKLRVWKLI